MILVITAPSGAGKTTIVKELFKVFPELKFSVSATTRTKRRNEQDGRDYYFVTMEDFQNKIKSDSFVEWEEVHGNFYGTLKSEVEKYTKNDGDIALDIDVNGALSIKRLYPEALTFFIFVPKDELISRLKKRDTESEANIKKRAERIEYETGLKDKFDHVIENESTPGGLQKAVNEIVKIINQYRKK